MIYLLHLDPPYRHARHYLGFTTLTSEERIERHLRGHGSPLIRAALAAGGEVKLVRAWNGDRSLERRLKRSGGHGVRLCPICRPLHLAQKREKRLAREARVV